MSVSAAKAARLGARGDLHLVGAVADRTVAFELAAVEHVMPMLLVDPVPGGPSGLVGFANVAGEPVAVLRVRTLFGLPDVPDDADHRIVVCAHRGRSVGLVVDEVSGLAAPKALRSPTVDDRVVALEVVKAIGLVGARLCTVLDPAVVVDWLTIYEEGASPRPGASA